MFFFFKIMKKSLSCCIVYEFIAVRDKYNIKNKLVY